MRATSVRPPRHESCRARHSRAGVSRRSVRPLFAPARAGTGVAGNQDRRCHEVPGTQQRDQIEPVHSRHILVDNQAAAEVEIAGTQQLGAGRIAADRQAFDLEREFERIANGEIIVDDDNDVSGNRRSSLVFHRSCLPSRALWPGDQKAVNETGRFDLAQIRCRRLRQRPPRQELSATPVSGPRIPAMRAIRTRSDRLAACILVMRFAR